MIQEKNRHKGMTGIKPAANWEEAFPSGNGTLGALMMGEPNHETIIINHEALFLPLPETKETVLPDMSEDLPTLREKLREGRFGEATKFYMQRLFDKGFPPQMLWTDPFHPAFDLLIEMLPSTSGNTFQSYRRSLDFETGEVRVDWSEQGHSFQRRLFVSRADQVAALHMISQSGGRLNCEIKLTERPGKQHIKSTEIDAVGEWISFQSFYAIENGGYVGSARVFAPGAERHPIQGGMKILNASEILVIIAVQPVSSEDSSGLAALKERLEQIPSDYSLLLQRHVEIHQEMFRRVVLELPKGKDYNLSNEELLDKSKQGEIPLSLYEKVHDYGRYLLISSSGSLPPNLQGVWNGSWTPPWSSDYTLDENLQMMMWQVMPGNLPEAAHSYFNLIESFVPDWQQNARKLYGCRGILSSLRSTRSGLSKHLNAEFPMHFWTAGAGWLAQLFYDYYLYTLNTDFLKNRAIPFMKQIALFYKDFLVEGEDGKLAFIPSYSPENTPANSDSAVSINATMDIAVAKELLSNLISACRLLKLDGEDIADWEAILAKLPEYKVNSDGAIKEWAVEGLEDDYHHRHSSHLYPVFPGFEATREHTPELFDACHRAAELRMCDGLEAITGWGLAHLANSSARLKDGELAFQALSRVIRVFMYPNLFTTHNRGNCFQMDANLGFTAAMMEMLVFSKPGWVELLPALPKAFTSGRIQGMLLRGGALLKYMQWDTDARSIFVTIGSNVPCTLRVFLHWKIKAVQTDEVNEAVKKADDHTLELGFAQGEDISLKILF